LKKQGGFSRCPAIISRCPAIIFCCAAVCSPLRSHPFTAAQPFFFAAQQNLLVKQPDFISEQKVFY
jgi:hypothetical protein